MRMDLTLKCIIIDDEAKARRGLQKLLERYCPEIEIIAEADNIEKAYDLINALNPDFIFLDIQMPNGNGFKLLERFENLFFNVIFVTGYDQYAINAIKFSALDYLLKPVEVHDLLGAVKRAIKIKDQKSNSSTQIHNLLNIAENSSVDKRIVVHKNEKVFLLKLNDICYIEADDRYCHIVTQSSEKHLVTKTLKEFEEFLVDNRFFFRISKNYMLNINFIKNYTKGEPCFVEMYDGKNFEISRRKKQEFLERLKND